MGVMDRYNEKKKKKKDEEKLSKSKSSGGVAERYEKNKYYETLDVDSVNDGYIDAFTKDASSFFKGLGENSISYKDANSTLKDLGSRYDTIEGWIYKNRRNFDDKSYKDITSWSNEVKSSLDSVRDYYSQFKSEYEYNDAVKVNELYNMPSSEISPHLDKIAKSEKEKKAKISSLSEQKKTIQDQISWYRRGDTRFYKSVHDVNDAQKQIAQIDEQIKQLKSDNSGRIAYTTSTGQNVTWQNLYDRKKDEEDFNALYSSVSGSEDFEKSTEAGKSYQNPDWKEAEKGKSVVNKVKYLEDNYGQIAIGEANGGGSNIVHSRLSLMKEEEKNIYNYYFGRGEYDKAEEYLQSLDKKLIDRFEEREIETFKTIADKAPVLSSGLSVAATLFSGAEHIKDSINYAQTGELDDNHFANVSQAIRGAVSEKVNWEIGNWDAFDFVYNTSMSMADSMTAMSMFGWGGGTVLGLSAAAQGTNDALNRGMTNGEAFMSGLSSGTYEMLFETLSIGSFKALKEVPAHTFKEFAKNMGKSMLVNASEETLTEIANVAYDMMVNADFSQADTKIRAYMAAGMSEAEARNKVTMELVGQVVEAGASGALMGIGMSAGAHVIGKAQQNAEARELYRDSQKELVAEGLETAEGTLSNNLAQKYQQRLDKGKNLTGGQLSKLVYANDQSFVAEDVASITEAATSRLTELGERGDVSFVASALAKQAAGQELTLVEEYAIRDSKYGQRVANELNPENIRSGEYTSAWAEKLDTNKINVNEYSRLVNEAETAQEGEKATPEATVLPTVETVQETATEAAAVPAAQVTTEKVEGIQQPDAVSEEITSEEAETESTITIEDASQKYGAQAKAMVHTYQEGQDVAKYDSAYQQAYNMGQSGVALSYAMNSESTQYLTEAQRELAYEAGKAAGDAKAQNLDAKNKAEANGKTVRKKGVVRGEGVKIADLKKTFNDPQGKAYKYLSTVAEATGIDIVLFRSELGADGKFIGEQGRYEWDNPGTIYLDINAGLSYAEDVGKLAKYTMLRTFAHEFTHFMEKWNPIQYNEFRKAVFDKLAERGENVHDLIEETQARRKGISYEVASHEVLADAMTDILPDTNFVQDLAENHKNIFQKLLEKLKEFVANLRDYFNSIAHNNSRTVDALREQVGDTIKYVDSIVELFDKVAVQAVENYQATVAAEEVKAETAVEASTSIDGFEAAKEYAEGKGYSIKLNKLSAQKKMVQVDIYDKNNLPTFKPVIINEDSDWNKVREAIDKRESETISEWVNPFDKRTTSLLNKAKRVAAIGDFKGHNFVSDNAVLIPTTKYGVQYAEIELNARTLPPDVVHKIISAEYTPITQAPVEGKDNTYRRTICIFDINGTKRYFDKKYLAYFDGCLLYYADFNENGGVIKAVNPDGSLKGYVVGMAFKDDSAITDQKPSKLKSFSKKNQANYSQLTPGQEGTVVDENGDPVAHATEDGTVRLNIRTYEESGRAAFRAYLDKCVKGKKLTKAEAQEMMDGIEDFYQTCMEFKDKYAPFSTWSDAAVVRDTFGKPVFSVVTPNGDYKMNLDFSLVCKKRRTLDAVFNEMAKRGIIDDFELGQKSVVKINEIIRKFDLETACALCFVDAKRFRQASMADSFTKLYNELVYSLVPEGQINSIEYFNFSGYKNMKKLEDGIHTWDTSKLDFSHINHVLKTYEEGTVEHKAAKYIKSNPEGRKLLLRGDFMSSGGFDAVKSQNPDVMKLYNSKKGTGGPKAAFGDVQYMNEIIQKARWWTPAKAYAVGGIRIQSFSDYVPRMVFDYAQMVYDLAAAKLPAHAYTKEALFVKQFGLTGIKINMSLIPAIAKDGVAPGLDANGDYVWAGESFDFETAKEIQNAEGYTENCGTICVGVSREHILKLLSDPDIRMVIPYHKSGLNPVVAHMNNIADFTDYTSLKTNPGGCQSTIDKNGSKVENDFNFNNALKKTGDPKAAVKQYLDWCAKNEYTPRFAEFAWHENYYKLIEDFTLYDKDGNHVPQREVKAVFPTEDSAFGSMKSLIQEGLEEDAIVEGKREKNLSAIVDEIEKNLPRTEAEVAEDQVEQADHDLEAVVRKSDRDYQLAVEYGDMETAQKMVKEAAAKAGYTSDLLYHGTDKFGFTKIDVNKVLGKIAFFATNSFKTGASYANVSAETISSEKTRQIGKKASGTQEVDLDSNDDSYKPKTRSTNAVKDGSASGVYGLYASEKKQLVIQANGKHWTEVPLGKLAKAYTKWYAKTKGYDMSDGLIESATTKAIAAFAKDSGYRSVRFANINDIGGYSLEEAGASDVYAFFYPDADVKSADPVTYDDKGKVIPLSERFEKKNNDIRYSQRDTRDSEGHKLSEQQMRYFADSVVRDDKGRLLPVYHGTEDAGFTVFSDKKGRGIFFAKSLDTTKSYSQTDTVYAPDENSPEISGAANYKVYLNITNPLVIQGKGAQWNHLEAEDDIVGLDISVKSVKEDGTCNVVVKADIKGKTQKHTFKNAADVNKFFTETFNEDYAYGITQFLDAYAAKAETKQFDLSVELLWDFEKRGYGNRAKSTRDIVREAYGSPNKYDGVVFKNIVDPAHGEKLMADDVYVAFESNQIKSVNNIDPTKSRDIRYSERDYAPTFYSHMGKVIDGIKTEKVGANGVVPYLKGKGVKNEEIKWSGIEAFLEGKKSLTKADLQEFVAGSMLQIEEHISKAIDPEMTKIDNGIYEIVLNGDSRIRLLDNGVGTWFDDHTGGTWSSPEEAYEHFKAQNARLATKWSDYKLDGGTNYRELVFKMPNSSYTNRAMQAHWGNDAEGVLAHARIQDFNTPEGKMLFVEEIQSDWHNAGHKEGYHEPGRKNRDQLQKESDKAYKEFYDIVEAMFDRHGEWAHPVRMANLFEGDTDSFKYLEEIGFSQEEISTVSAMSQGEMKRREEMATAPSGKSAPDAPFKGNYHEYVLKRLIRMAAEEGYDSIGWTTADIQSDRWSDEYAEGYRIEYDQDIPKFLNKYGKKWGAKVDKTRIGGKKLSFKEELDLVLVEDMYTEAERDSMRGIYEVWSMPITDSMKESVLYEGQARFQARSYEDDGYDTEGVHWGMAEGIMSKADARIVWEAIADIQKRGYNSYQTTVNGEHIVASDNALFFVETNYRYPSVNKIIRFDETYEINCEYAKEMIINAEGHPTRHREALQDVEDIFGQGYVTEYNREIYQSDARENRGTERADSSSDSSGTEQYQQRTDTLTDREVLSMAADQIKVDGLTDGEKSALDIIKNRLGKLESLQEERAELGRQYKEQQFGENGDRKEAKETLNRMHILDGQIEKAETDVLAVEDKAVLKSVLQKARKVVQQNEREHGQEILKRWRDRRDNAAAIKKYRERLRGDVDELSNWMLHPDNKSAVKHIPDALKDTVVPFLSSINFMSKQSLRGGNPTKADQAFIKQLRGLEKIMENTVELDEMYSNYTDLPPDFMKNLRGFINTAQDLVDKNSGEFIINQMTAEEIKTLSKVVRTLKKHIMDMNRFHVNSMFKHVYEAGDNSIEFLSQMKPADNTGAVSQFLLWQQMRPAYAFERFGEGGKAIYDGLRRGQATLAYNTKKIIEFSKKAYKPEEVKAWEKEVKTIQLGEGRKVKMSVAQIMSLYELSKRKQAEGHIFGEGIRVATFKNGKKKISDVGRALTPAELNIILNELTPHQKEVADNLQQFMQKQGGEWGNYVTVARFGEKMFGEENYFPINSDGRHLQVDADEKPGAAALYALLNMGFTKQVQEKARNRIVIYSIFDVFANHMASMAQYNALALPVVDALKWFNYQQVALNENGSKTIMGSVREQMDRAYGVPEENKPGSGKKGYAQNFVINIIKAYNGTEAQGTSYDSMGLKHLHHYNRAQVAYNFRVVVQQPMAITRAALLIDYSSILKGMKLNPKVIKKNIEEMREHSGIAAWKSLGFYDVNISRGLTSLIKHDDSALDKVIDVGMKGAEVADTLTWAAMWSACKTEVIKKQKLKPGSDGFYEAVTKLFEDVVYKTQVVDSVLTKNEFMRDKGFWARAVGSFMSEPTTTASMLVDAVDKYNRDLQRGMTKKQAWDKNKKLIGRTMCVYAVGSILLAAAQAAVDAFRDDDEYEERGEKWLEAFFGNFIDELLPFNKLPIVGDFYEVAKELIATWTGLEIYGNPPNSVFMQWYDSLVKGNEILHDKITEEDTPYTYYAGIFKMLQAASGITGLPMATATRSFVNAWNSTIGAMAPSLKVKSYDPGEEAEIKYAYLDGYLTEQEAVGHLVSKGLAEDENDAYFTIQGWEGGEGYSRYETVYDAVLKGESIDTAMEDLIAHGYDEEDVISQVKTQIGKWYYDEKSQTRITKQQATDMLTKYTDMDSEDINKLVNKWSSKVVTGISFSEIGDEYIKGNITRQRAVEMYVRYGGYTKAEAENKVQYAEFQKEYPNYKLTESQVTSYYSKLKSSGLGVPEYAKYVERRKSCKGVDSDNDGKADSGTVKTQVMEVINSLPITRAQKDALYYLNGWAASKLNEAPWH